METIIDIKPGDAFKTDDGDILLVTFEEDNDESRFIVIISLKTYTVVGCHDKGNTQENINDAVGFLNFLKCTKASFFINAL